MAAQATMSSSTAASKQLYVLTANLASLAIMHLQLTSTHLGRRDRDLVLLLWFQVPGPQRYTAEALVVLHKIDERCMIRCPRRWDRHFVYGDCVFAEILLLHAK